MVEGSVVGKILEGLRFFQRRRVGKNEPGLVQVFLRRKQTGNFLRPTCGQYFRSYAKNRGFSGRSDVRKNLDVRNEPQRRHL